MNVTACVNAVGALSFSLISSVRDTVYMPYPVKEYETQIIERLIPGKVIHDTVTKAIIQIDTPLIARDYLIRREYLQKFFDSKEQGRLVVSTSVQYNKQSQISIDYEPVVKEIYRDKEPVFIPFLSAGYNTLNYYSIGGGMFYRDVGFEYGYNRNLTLKTDYHDGRINREIKERKGKDYLLSLIVGNRFDYRFFYR